jgi:hypothetical protein
MDGSGSSRCQATSEETIPSDEDPSHKICCGQWVITRTNLPSLALL